MITIQEYTTLDSAYQYFNEKLWDGKLPDCIVTLHRKKGANGYYWHEKFVERDGNKKISEIALNPDTFNERTDTEILATLVHEQCHLAQHLFGDAPKSNYHDKEFAKFMYDVGLIPTSNGEINGKRTGVKISTLIQEGGLFEKFCGAFLISNKINVQSTKEIEIEKKSRKKTRQKLVCPSCMENARARIGMKLICGECNETMLPEEDEDES